MRRTCARSRTRRARVTLGQFLRVAQVGAVMMWPERSRIEVVLRDDPGQIDACASITGGSRWGDMYGPSPVRKVVAVMI
jgi:hypothetical protein